MRHTTEQGNRGRYGKDMNWIFVSALALVVAFALLAVVDYL